MFPTFHHRFRRPRRHVRTAPPTPVEVTFVDDPDGRVRLIRASGRLTAESISVLSRAWEHLSPPRIIHLDAAALQIADATAMRLLEAAFDRLERLRIDLRVVGIDPTHPALSS